MSETSIRRRLIKIPKEKKELQLWVESYFFGPAFRLGIKNVHELHIDCRQFAKEKKA